jgi:hypothetical protein
MKKILLLTAIVSYCSCYGQRSFNHVVFGEGGGAAVMGSINYDMRFSKKSPDGLGIRAGFGLVLGSEKIYFGSEYAYDNTNAQPVALAGLNYLSAHKNSPHAFELGLSMMYASEKTFFLEWGNAEVKDRWIPSAAIGYRRQPIKSGFLWRADFTPFLLDGTIYPWLGLSIGWKL